MALRSKLFRGDRALESCLVLDSAHITLGAQGEHVRKIQKALLLLDNADIVSPEILSKKYGPSTANAVLAYKRKRSIINFSYQKQADNIVGKMTIAALDQEVLFAEARSVGRPSCVDELGGGGGSRGLASGGATGFPGGTRSLISRQNFSLIEDQIIPKSLNIHWQRTSAVTSDQNKSFFDTILPRAGELVAKFGMAISFNGDASSATIPYPDRVTVDHTDAHLVRKAAQKAFAGSPKVLRVILCPIDSAKAFAFTSGQGFDPFQNFANYILINVNKPRADKGTLLHEMIHVATNLPESSHDSQDDSIFSIGTNRTVFKAEHALAINNAFFATV